MRLVDADYLTGRIFTEASLKNAHTCYESIMAIIKSMKSMESEDVLDKIRAEIDQIKPYDLPSCDRTAEKMISRVLDIIDKYRGEQP